MFGRSRQLTTQVDALEKRVEDMENLLADLTQNGRIVVQMSLPVDHSNGRGLGPEAARRYNESQKQGRS